MSGRLPDAAHRQRLAALLELAGNPDGFRSMKPPAGSYTWSDLVELPCGGVHRVARCSIQALERRGWVLAEQPAHGGRFYRVTDAGREVLD